MSSQKLFAFYLGGSIEGANLEIHNLQFAVGKEIKDCYEQLKTDWFGNKNGLHIDSYIAFDFVDGYKIEVLTESNNNFNEAENKLFCVHLGASQEGILEELHYIKIVVAKSEKEALVKVRNELKTKNRDWSDLHKDNLFEVENLINLSEKFSLNIIKTDSLKTYQIVNKYIKI